METLTEATETYSAFQLHATIKAPVLLLPQDVAIDESPVLLCDFGSLDIQYSHKSMHSMPELQRAQERSNGFFVDPALSDYSEKLDLIVSDMQVRVLGSRDSGEVVAGIASSIGDTHDDCLVLPTSLSVHMGMKTTAWAVDVDVGDISIRPSPAKLQTMNSIVSSIQ